MAIVVLGIGVVTAAFFAAHSVASGWISARTARDQAQAGALYLLFYYLGSSILGSLGGLGWTSFGWTGIALYTGGLITVALALALWLARVPAPEVLSSNEAQTTALEGN